MHQYFISYNHSTGFGSTVIGQAGPITSWDDIVGLINAIAAHNGLSQVVILNFQLLGVDA